jgi:hypothetical protein
VARDTHTNVIALHANSGRGAMQRKPAHRADSVTDIPYDAGRARGGPFLAEPDVDGLACQFLHSDYAGAMYVQWPLDRRLEGFLHYRGLTRVADDGDLYNMVLNRVMTQISTATVRDPGENPVHPGQYFQAASSGRSSNTSAHHRRGR